MESDDGADSFSEEEELLAKQETFERKYNFRFEEPEADQVSLIERVTYKQFQCSEKYMADLLHSNKGMIQNIFSCRAGGIPL